MQSLPPRIHGETNCVSLRASDRPWSVVRTGQLLTGQAYARRKPHLLDLRDLDRPQRSLLQGTFAKLHEPASAIHLLKLREPLVFGQGSVVLPDGQLIHANDGGGGAGDDPAGVHRRLHRKRLLEVRQHVEGLGAFDHPASARCRLT